MSSTRVLYGFHAVTVRLKTAPGSIVEVHVDTSRRDARMRQFVQRVQDAGVKLVDSDAERLAGLAGVSVGAGAARHQGVVARVQPLPARHSLDEVLDE
ncbi:MAG: RNA methyltransferase substrate-binding domain-containing protein, partial [Rubrivivax sp.]